VDKLEDQYAAALRDFLVLAREASLQEAYELGRRALSDGRGVFEMATLYHQALVAVLSQFPPASEAVTRMVQAGQAFFVESLSPFEMAHRGFRDANMALRRLNEKLEQEAKRIAHALHDEAGQLLASVHIALEEATMDLLPRDRLRLQPVRELLDQIEGELRRVAYELRPTILDDLGLAPALESLVGRIAARGKIQIDVANSLSRRLPAQVETALYRVVQEALNNVLKHAQASHVTIRIDLEDYLVRCSVQDDGVGFDQAVVLGRQGKQGLGLLGIRERIEALGGTWVITSIPRQGTTLSLTIPVVS
jgi:signal transduction histidine kinase